MKQGRSRGQGNPPLIESKMQKPLNQLMQQALFDPLGMTRTSIIYRTQFAADVADHYDLNEKFRSETKHFRARAAGSMTSSAGAQNYMIRFEHQKSVHDSADQ
jgi:CubicO group peptidase (beta-lactamase class C family)